MAKKAVAKQALKYLLGVCVPSNKQNAAYVRVKQLEFDSHIKMYFGKNEFIYATDPMHIANVGDTVLIQTLPEKLTRIINHKVIEVIYPLGDITDPISGKKIVAGKYRDDIDEDAKLFGVLDSKFSYDKAPPRGHTKDVRDFTSKNIYVKYNEDPNDTDPYAVYPK